MARKIGLSNIVRVSSTVLSNWTGPKPGVIAAITTGARMNRPTARIVRAISMRLMTVDTTRQACDSSPPANSAETIGMRADDRAPAATSWKIRSGRRNAAKNVSRSPASRPELAMTTKRM